MQLFDWLYDYDYLIDYMIFILYYKSLFFSIVQMQKFEFFASVIHPKSAESREW